MGQRAVKAIREVQTAGDVAAAFGVNLRNVYRWLADFANGGKKAPLATAIPGRPPKISARAAYASLPPILSLMDAATRRTIGIRARSCASSV